VAVVCRVFALSFGVLAAVSCVKSCGFDADLGANCSLAIELLSPRFLGESASVVNVCASGFRGEVSFADPTEVHFFPDASLKGDSKSSGHLDKFLPSKISSDNIGVLVAIFLGGGIGPRSGGTNGRLFNNQER
jgi:hypothetical protein